MMEYKGRITSELALNNVLVFKPKTPEEAEQIQKNLFALGVEWADHVNKVRVLTECVNNGMNVVGGLIRYGINSETMSKGLLCKLQQFGGSSDEQIIPAAPEEMVTKSFMTDLFNTLSTQIDQQNILIEQQRQIIEKLSEDKFGSPAFKRTQQKPDGKGAGS